MNANEEGTPEASDTSGLGDGAAPDAGPETLPEDAWVVLRQGPPAALGELQESLRAAGVESRVASPPDSDANT